MNGIQKAIKQAGSNNKLATMIQTHRQNIDNWARSGEPPAEFCPAIKQATGVSLAELRPDIFPKRCPHCKKVV